MNWHNLHIWQSATQKSTNFSDQKYESFERLIKTVSENRKIIVSYTTPTSKLVTEVEIVQFWVNSLVFQLNAPGKKFFFIDKTCFFCWRLSAKKSRGGFRCKTRPALRKYSTHENWTTTASRYKDYRKDGKTKTKTKKH